MPDVEVGWVRITANDPPLEVIARLGEERPSVESGYGGWDEVARPRRSPLTTFTARPGLHLTLSILLDGWADDVTVERDVDQLDRMGRPSGSNREPPRLRIATTGSAIPYQHLTWVLSELSWGDALMNDDGDRVRQAATLTLIEYVEDVHLAERSAANRRRQKAQITRRKAGASVKRVTVKKSSKTRKRATAHATADAFGEGEDLLTIAARELGDASRWVEIAELNGLRDPRALSPGMVIRLP